MNSRKLFALLMTAVMLLGMVPAGYAEGGNMMPGGEFTVSCNHNWAWRFPNGEPKHCQEERLMEMYCTLCGQVASSYPVTGDHTPGSWQWDGTPPANCYEWGIQNQSCSVCGEVFNEREMQGDHQWGGFTTVVPAGCETPGEEATYCTVCGERGSSREIPAKGHDWGDWKWEVKATCNKEGLRVRYCKRCNMREEDSVSGGDHQWGKWKTDQAATCTEGGSDKKTCSVCGQSQTRKTDPLGHSFGDWKDDIKPTCTEPGLQCKTCSRCGENQWQYKGKLNHVFGEWYVVKEPEVGVPGLEQHDCTFGCGTCEQREIPALEPESTAGLELALVLSSTPANGTHFVVGEKVTFTETWANGTGKTLYPFSVSIWTCDTPVFGSAVDQICSWFAEDGGGPVAPGVSGSHTLTVTVTEDDVARGAIYAMAELLSTVQDGADLENVTTPFVTAPCGEGSLSADGLDLTLVLSSTPANGTHFVVGEKVTFTETWANGTDKTLYPFTVSICTCDTPAFGSAVDQICSWFAEDGGGPVAPGASGSHTLTVTVTEDDVARGAIYAMVELLSTVQDGADLENVATPFVTAPCGSDNSGDFGLSDGLSVTKKVTSIPANGSFYVPGETVTYEVCVKNNGEPLNMLCVSDWMRDGTFKYGTIETGEDVTYPISYTVIELDATSGSVSNISFAEAVAANGDPVLEYSNSVTVPCGFPEGDDPFGIFRSLAVVKAEESMPLNGEYYTEGEVIHYTITYTNDGELPLTDVQVWDVMNVTAPVASAEMLNPGESRVCYYQHTVTAEDVAAGFVMNIAHASYPVSSYAGFENSTSNAVYSKTSADDNIWIELPIFPAPGEDPVYDPGTGWLPPEEGEEMPGFGTIDTDTLHSGDSYCVRTITGRDNVSATYETAFCTEHADTQSSALIMMQVAVTPETQMQAAAYAVALWRTEVETLYQKVFESADATAKTVVMTEYVRFLTDVGNYEAMLKALYPDQPALVALKVAEIWENKCVEMCYDAHATAAERTDSLLAVTPTTGATAAECTCVTTAETNGQRTDAQTYCPAHSFPFGMMDALLQGNDTAEAWTMVRQIWGVELTAAYNKVYAAMGDNKLLAMAEYNALTQWMMAREASLTALYPDHPEIVVQLMVKTIMERVNALCQAVN